MSFCFRLRLPHPACLILRASDPLSLHKPPIQSNKRVYLDAKAAPHPKLKANRTIHTITSSPKTKAITVRIKRTERTVKPMNFLAGDIGISFQASSLTLP